MFRKRFYKVKLLDKRRSVDKGIEQIVDACTDYDVVQSLLLEATSGGRRFRPLLLLIAAQGSGGNWRQAVDLACAVEILHKASLAHDDLIDSDSMRRGGASFWRSRGERMALVVGDALVAIAFSVLQEWAEAAPGPRADSISKTFSAAMRSMAFGEILDLDFECRDAVSMAQVAEMNSLKSGSLISASLKIGAVFGDAPSAIVDCLARFGLHVGAALQGINDMNNLNEVDVVSKGAIGSDLLAQKKTLATVGASKLLSSGFDLSKVSAGRLQDLLVPARTKVESELAAAARCLEELPSGRMKQIFSLLVDHAMDKWFWMDGEEDS